MPKPQVLLTPEAKEVLEAAKAERQGFSECLLASEAILKAYGLKHPVAGGRVRDVSAEAMRKAASLLLKHGGSTRAMAALPQGTDSNADNLAICEAIKLIEKEAGI